MTGPLICPDCRGGKHDACIGRAWDEYEEAEVPCECICRRNKETP